MDAPFTPFRLACHVAILLLAALAAAAANPLYVDPAKGGDANPGTKEAPLQTLAQALAAAKGGTTILLAAGEYPAIEYPGKAGENWFEGDYVTIKPAPDVADPLKAVSIARVQIGSRSGTLAGEDRKGSFDVFLRLENLRIPDGVFLFGGKHFQLIGCRIERIGPWTGSEENIEKTAVSFGGCSDLLVENCEVTNTGTGLALQGSEIRVLRNRIHDIRHDGIRCVSLKDSLIEGNEIFNLDDGVDDSDAKWSRHCDAIHIFIPGPGVPGAQNSRVTVRGNRIYNCESQGMQFNNYLRNKELWNEDITIENNVFGPTRANAVNIADPVDGLIFRHNTFVPFPGGRSFQGEGREIHCDNTTFRISPNCKRAQVYNNILTNTVAVSPGWFASHNVIVSESPNSVPTRFDVMATEAGLVQPEAFDGRLAANSPAINAGTRLAPAGIFESDLHGTPRDARPDAGAYELAGQNPPKETPPLTFTPPARVWLDDFKDANIHEDPWLAGPGQRGLSWLPLAGQSPWSFRAYPDDDGQLDVVLTPQGLKETSWMFSQEELPWTKATLTLTVRNAYNQIGAGVLLAGNLDTEGFVVDLAAGRIVQRTKGADGKISETLLAEGKAMLPRLGGGEFVIHLSQVNGDTRIRVESGEESLEATVKGPLPAGRLALFSTSPNGSHRTDFSEVKVEL